MKGWIDHDTAQSGDKVEALLERMWKNGKVPNLVTYQLVVEALIKSSRGRRQGIAKAEAMIKDMEKGSSNKNKNLRPNAKLANMVLQGKVSFGVCIYVHA